jgi:hypothetical protein
MNDRELRRGLSTGQRCSWAYQERGFILADSRSQPRRRERSTHTSPPELNSTHLPTASACHLSIFSPVSSFNRPSSSSSPSSPSIRAGVADPVPPPALGVKAPSPAGVLLPLEYLKRAAAADDAVEVEEVVDAVASWLTTRSKSPFGLALWTVSCDE